MLSVPRHFILSTSSCTWCNCVRSTWIRSLAVVTFDDRFFVMSVECLYGTSLKEIGGDGVGGGSDGIACGDCDCDGAGSIDGIAGGGVDVDGGSSVDAGSGGGVGGGGGIGMHTSGGLCG